MVRRYFHRYMNDKHYNKERNMYMNETRGERVVTNQEIINSLQVAISKLDQIISDMSKTVKEEK